MSSSRLFLDGMLSSSARLRFARPRSECVKVVLPVEKFAANGELSLNCLSHPRGQPQLSSICVFGKLLYNVSTLSELLRGSGVRSRRARPEQVG
jgi:hypothetical protein